MFGLIISEDDDGLYKPFARHTFVAGLSLGAGGSMANQAGNGSSQHGVYLS